MCRLLHTYYLYSISMAKISNVLVMCFYFSLVLSTLLLLFALKYAPKEYKLLFIANYCWEGLGAGREGDNRG